jgi:hypothetical protein
MPSASERRPDFSHGLVHLTKERGGVKVFNVLKEILSSGVLRASGHEGFIKGKRKAVCLSEIPLSAVHYFASRPEKEDDVRYRFYGIALSKKAVFDAGGRPVIYLPDAEADWIPDDQKWRHVRFEHPAIDWTHEREWRVVGDLDLSKFPGVYVLVWSATEAKEIQKMESPIKSKIRGVLAMEHLTQFL